MVDQLSPAAVALEAHSIDSIATDFAADLLQRAAETGASTALRGRVVVTCDRLPTRPGRYYVARDGTTILWGATARHAHAVVAALHVTLIG